jgi:hypothetical protein
MRKFAAVLLMSLLSGAAGAATPKANAGAEDLPDFTGVWARAPEPEFLPVPGSKDAKPINKLPVTGPDASEIIAGNWDNPFLLPWARDVVKNNALSEMRLQHVNQADDICWPTAVPQILNLREAVQFIQMKDRLLIVYQRDHFVRDIRLNKQHPANVKPSWFGDSVGHWEGDTLVVDTVGIKTHKMSVVDTYGTPHTEKLHVTERYRLIEDDKGKGIEFVLHVEDPGAYAMPWGAIGYYRPNRVKEIQEVVCAENNREFDGSFIPGMPEEKTPSF